MAFGGFPGSSDGKEFACSAGDLDSIPEFGRSAGEREWLSIPVLPGEFIPWTEEPGWL